MRLISAVAILLATIFTNFPSLSNGYSVRNLELPTLRVVIVPVNSNNPSRDETVLHKPTNSDLVVGEGEEIPLTSRLILECDADYPVQFIYTGDGMPEYTTNTSQSDSKREEGGPPPVTKPKNLFLAQLYLGYGRQLGSYDTGKYTCRSLQNAGKAAHYYLFVSDGKLFIRQEGDTVYFRRTDPNVRIPCSVSHPKAIASLQKSVNGLIQCPLNDSISFEPTSGFQLKTSNRFDPAGIYVCTAGYKGTYQAIQYVLVAEGSSSGQNQGQGQQGQGGSSTSERLPCRRDVDCPNTEACLNNGHCGSPCSSSCGQNTSCRVKNHLAECQCLPGYQGNPYVSCSTPAPEQIQQPSDPCSPFPCGTNTVCDNHNGIAKCSCSPGYQGDPYYRCYRRSDPCNPNPCGPHSVCVNRNNYASCSCAQGFIGTPPHCRAECEGDYHCGYDQVCRMYRCRNPCDGACDGIPNTQCRVINRRPVCARYQRGCPTGYFGRDCSQLYERESAQGGSGGSRPASNEDVPEETVISPCVPFPCGSNAECVTRTVTNSALNETSEVALCQCPPGKTGSADMECYPVEEQQQIIRVITHEDGRHDLLIEEDTDAVVEDSTVQAEESTPDVNSTTSATTTTSEPPSSSSITTTTTAPTTSVSTEAPSTSTPVPPTKVTKKCGTNAIAILSVDGKQICSCPVGYTGLASIECHALNEEEVLRDDVGNDLVEPEYCDASNSSIICGSNAYCVIKNGTERCQCMRPFTGNPEIGCELECQSDSDCPTEYSCYTAENSTSGRCVDSCEPSLQMFFKQCGRDAFCKVEDHKPVCYCPQDLPHGDPSVHCKEKSWMPNHLPPTPLPSCEKRDENCGKNAECRQFHDSKTYCVCLPGYYGDPYDKKGPGCEQGLQCRNSTQCPPTKECVNGRCLDPCRSNKIQCGEYAGCSADENHKPKCICNIGTIRNPSWSCEPVKGALAERMALFRSFEDF